MLPADDYHHDRCSHPQESDGLSTLTYLEPPKSGYVTVTATTSLTGPFPCGFAPEQRRL